MALFKKIFGNKKSTIPSGFREVTIKEIVKETSDTVKIILDVDTSFKPGQYLTFAITIDGKQHRRSYSICSGKNEPIAVAVKQIEKGIISTWFNEHVEVGMTVLVSEPEGNFIVPVGATKLVAIAAGSGITPILSIAKSCEDSSNSLQLFYGSRTVKDTLFKSEIDSLKNTTCSYYLSSDKHADHQNGRIDKESFTAAIKNDLQLLKADCFLICGPEQMIVDVAEVLELFGVPKDKITYELFTTPVLMKSSDEGSEIEFNGTSSVTILLNGEKETFELDSNGKNILEKASENDIDVPYSCKGGVCSTCKAKVLKGKATMDMNYSLTDKEVEEGFILTCQAHPASKEIVVSYDA